MLFCRNPSILSLPILFKILCIVLVFWPLQRFIVINKDQAWSCFDPMGVVHVDIFLEI